MINNIYDALLNCGKGARNKEGDPKKNKVLYSLPWGGKKETIGEFYDSFIEERMPDKKILIQWHEMLMKYCELPNAVFFIRNGATAGNLRRGWLTRVDTGDASKNFSFVFSDNDCATYFYKMALDGFCPTEKELFDALNSFEDVNKLPFVSASKTIDNVYDSTQKKDRKFAKIPVHYVQCAGEKYPDKYENERNAYVINGCDCCLRSTYKYKHSHIFDAGNCYYYKNNTFGMADIEKNYYSLGDIDEYKWDNSINNYVREMKIDPSKIGEYKAIIKATFLRFIDPINHFLAPKAPFRGAIYNEYKDGSGLAYHDIAEYPKLLDYIKFKRINDKDLSSAFKSFMDTTLVFKFIPNDTSSVVIDISYGSNTINSKNNAVTSSKSAATKTNSNPSVIKIGKYAQGLFTDLLKYKKMSSLLIDELKDSKYCKLNFNLNYPLLADANSNPDNARYYAGEVAGYRICNDWYEDRNRVLLEEWKNKNGF